MGKQQRLFKEASIDLNEAARIARNKYHSKWEKENPEKVREIRRRYWAKKAAKAAEERVSNGNP